MRVWFVALIFGAILAPGAHAWQTTIPNYETAKDEYFWPRLYKNGGESLYCGAEFEAGERLTVEHVYPASWIAEAVGCDSRDCDAPGYDYAEADLHNLWPALGRINSSRSNKRFAELPGEDNRAFTDICPDYELTFGRNGFVEPRDSVKGDVARSILYMNKTYGLPLLGMRQMLVRWSNDDPPDAHERWRNDHIEALQGTRNPFTDNPTLALSVDVDDPAPTALTYSPNARTYSPTVRSPAPAARQCCKICRKGQACGNSCIRRTYTCSKPPGCACDGR